MVSKAEDKSIHTDRDSSSRVNLLLSEVERIDWKVRVKIAEKRRGDGQPDDFAGLYVSEKQIDTILEFPRMPQQKRTRPCGTDADSPAYPHTQTSEDAVDTRRSLGQGLSSRLDDLCGIFDLSPFDRDTILLCLLPELDLKYQRIYSYLLDDVTQKNPTVDLVLQLLTESFVDALKAREAFSPSAPLMKHSLLRLHENDPPGTTPLLGKLLQLDDRIISFLLEANGLDARLLPFCELTYPQVRLGDLILDDNVRECLTVLAFRLKEDNPLCHLQGHYGVGKHAAAEGVCTQLGMPILGVSIGKLAESDVPRELSLSLVFRESRLQKAAVYFDDFDLLLGGDKDASALHDLLLRETKDHPGWIFMAGEKEWLPGDAFCGRPFISIEFPIPSYSARKQIWERLWHDGSGSDADIDFGQLAGKFTLSGGQIHDAAAMARNLAYWRDPKTALITEQDLYSACRRQFRGTLGTFARKISAKYRWDDIILPEDQTRQLREICGYVKHRHMVYGDWGFDAKLSTGRGLNVLFAGPSGTGKTMAAEIMANELGLDLYKIDLSAVVSKYIGETEKNLERIFKEGQISNAILFFDEADALFGKRSEVRDSHDRYANIEMAYLLQRMDEYEGMVILATNLRKNMDEAFARRMQYAIEFPSPEEADRYRIWQAVFPPEAPLAPDIDLVFLARQFKVTGGNIKNIALCAAFLAAQDGGVINMESIIRATKREYQKLGKLCTESDFDRYFGLVKQ